MSVSTGMLRASDILANKVPVNMNKDLSFEEQSGYFLEMFSRKLGGIKAEGSTKVEWLEQRLYPSTCLINSIDASSATEISVDFPEFCHQNAYLYNTRTGEHYLVNEVVGGSVAGKVQVLNVDGTAGINTATAVNDVILIDLESHAEGETIPAGYQKSPEAQLTYIQQSDMTRNSSDIQMASDEYGLNQMLVDRKMKWIEYHEKMNRIFYTGSSQRETVSAGGPRRHMADGLETRITTNVTDFGSVSGALTLSAISTMLQTSAYKTSSGGGKIVGIFGANAYNSVSDYPDSAIRTTIDNNTWGKRLTKLKTPHGDLPFAYDPVLNADNGLADRMYLVNFNHLQRVQLKGLGVQMITNVQAEREIHKIEDLITGTFGMKVRLEERHHRAYGIEV